MLAPTWRNVRGGVERLVYSETNYWVGMCCDVAGALAFLVLGILWFEGLLVVGAAAILGGFLLWGFLEYALHRWVLHGPPSMARRGHARHHATPEELFSTPLFVIALAAAGVWTLLQLAVLGGLAALFVFGLYAGYNCFAVVHHLQHHHGDDLARLAYFGRLQQFHESHHYLHAVNYGISTTLWDRLFGTYQAPTASSSRERSGRSSGDRSRDPAPRAGNRTPS